LRECGVVSPFLAVSFGTKVEVKDWGEGNWRALIGRLSAKHPKLALVALGSPEEYDLSARLLACWRGSRANLCVRCSPRQSAAVFQRAALFAGHDSGPMHLAAVVGTPCVAIFSARAVPGQWFPRGRHHEVIYHQCITSITVQEAFEAVERQLSKCLPQYRRDPEHGCERNVSLP
jgi:ADP-heptose:LPS heptosyltransferase